MKTFFRIFFLCLVFSLGWLGNISIWAVDEFGFDATHRGLITVKEKYQIFPERRMGNGLYRNQKLLFSSPDQMILDVAEIQNQNSLVYLYEGVEGNLEIGAYGTEESVTPSLQRVDDEFYEVMVPRNQLRRIFRITEKQQLVKIFDHVRSARGVTPSHKLVAFYHITDVKEQATDTGDKQTIYTFRLHILNRSNSLVKSLPFTVNNTIARIQLSWLNERTLQVRYSDGTTQNIELPQYLPNFF